MQFSHQPSSLHMPQMWIYLCGRAYKLMSTWPDVTQRLGAKSATALQLQACSGQERMGIRIRLEGIATESILALLAALQADGASGHWARTML